MKNFFFILLALTFFYGCGQQGTSGGGANNGKMETNIDSISYAMGAFFVKQFLSQGINVAASELGRGYGEGLSGNAYMDEQGANNMIMKYQLAMGSRQGQAFTADDPFPVNADSFSYALGVDFAKNMEQYEIVLNPGFMETGASEYGSENQKFDDGAIDMKLQELSMMAQEKQMAVSQEKAAGNKEEGAAFIAEKAKEDGVMSTPSGLHYKVLTPGTGNSPEPTNTVKVHYEGRLIDGQVFDSSYERGEPTEFVLNRVIPGWTEGLQLMKEGAKYQFYIPSDLAYGDMGSGRLIGPGATLVFDVELLEVK